MKVGVLADTHDNLPNLRRALELFSGRGAHALVHAGDVVAPFAAKVLRGFSGPTYAVFGNNDGERVGLGKLLDIVEAPREISLGGRRIVVAHDLSQITEGLAASADVIVTGHTHAPEITEGKPLRINPGETGGWVTERATCVLLDLDSLKGELCELAGE